MAFTVEQLTAIGGNEWRKGNKHRVYFNNLGSWYGVRTERYKSGHISGATLDGEPISNSKAHRLLVDLERASLYYDVAEGTFVSYGLTNITGCGNIFSDLVAAIKELANAHAAAIAEAPATPAAMAPPERAQPAASAEATVGIGRVPADVDPVSEARAEAEAQRLMAAMPGAASAGGFAPAGTTEASSTDTDACAICGQAGHWNPGAGQTLCARHWDEY